MYKDGYYVIGGHYSPFCYGHTKTLHAAKLLATKTLNTGTTCRVGIRQVYMPHVTVKSDHVAMYFHGLVTTNQRDGL